MRTFKWFGGVAVVAVGIMRCVGDVSVVPAPLDGGGNDATTDVATPDGGAPGDALSDAGMDVSPPTPDGSLAWFGHYNSNLSFGDMDLAGSSVIVGGGFSTDEAGTPFSMGSHQLGPSSGIDAVIATVIASGPVWATSPFGEPTASKPPTCFLPQNDDIVLAVAVDAAGVIYVAGSSDSAYMILKDEPTGPMSFVAAYTSTGTPIWDHVYRIGTDLVNGTDQNGAAQMSLAVQGTTLFVSFGYAGTLTYDTGDAGAQTVTSLASSQDVFVAALDTNTGATKWHTSFGSTQWDYVGQIAATSGGDVVLTGTMAGTMVGPTGTGFPLASPNDAGGTSGDAYVVKLSGSNGNSLYATAYGDASGIETDGLSIAWRAGQVAVAGRYQGAPDFGTGPLANQGDFDGFVFSFDEASKKSTFALPLSGSGNDTLASVAFDGWGEVVTVGYYGQNTPASATFDGALLPQTTTQVSGMLVGKLDPKGALLWSHTFIPTEADGGVANVTFPDTEDIFGVRVRVGSGGQVVVAGGMSGGTNFGSGYQALLSTSATATGCRFLSLKCQCWPPNGPPPDAFIGVWQP